MKNKRIICLCCKKEFETTGATTKFCSTTCRKNFKLHKLFPDEAHVKCKICGLEANSLINHIISFHKLTVEEYCTTFKCTRHQLITDALHVKLSNSIKKAAKEGKCGWQVGAANPSQTTECKAGRRSPWSKNFKGYAALTPDEISKKIKALYTKSFVSMNANNNNHLRLDYYISRGYSEEEAGRLLHDRQRTFTLDKCIKKYGQELGKKVFADRQEKWQNTLKSKSAEEIDRINRAKTKCSRFLRSYSKISQKLFNQLYEKIKHSFTNVYFATLIKDTPTAYNNYEYEVLTEDNYHKYYLDFYIEDNNKIIEFDGDYWHGEKRGNLLRDNLREAHLKRLGYTNIFHVKERDYNTNPDKVINDCLEFIWK